MTGRRDPGAGAPEGWGAHAEEASGGTLEPSSELEEALREAAEAIDESGRVAARDPVPAAAEPAAEPGEVARLAAELAERDDKLLRVLADFENFRRRALKERTESNQYGHQNLVKDLLPTVDNLERAIAHARKSGGGDLEGLLQGVELVLRELVAALSKHGVVVIDARGKSFDPAIHEAMAQLPDGSVPPNTIVEELQKGYQLRDRLLRPARVVVARTPESTPPEGGADG